MPFILFIYYVDYACTLHFVKYSGVSTQYVGIAIIFIPYGRYFNVIQTL